MQRADVHTRRLVGGALCLDFANSIDWTADGSERPPHSEALLEPEDLAAWGERAGVVPAGARLEVTGRELSAARLLRRALRDVFAAVAGNEAPGPNGLALLKATFLEAVTAAELGEGDDGWRFAWKPDDARRVRYAAAVDAVELLSDPARLARLRMCPGNNCGWLFLDTSGRRRWCSMEVCGSRAKMRRLYRRRQAQRSATDGRAVDTGAANP